MLAGVTDNPVPTTVPFAGIVTVELPAKVTVTLCGALLFCETTAMVIPIPISNITMAIAAITL
jgi:hypothetical protein